MGIMRRHRREKGILEDCAEGNNKRIRRNRQIWGSQRTHLRIGRTGCTVIKCIRRIRGIQRSAIEEVYKRSAFRKYIELSIEKNKKTRSSVAYSATGSLYQCCGSVTVKTATKNYFFFAKIFLLITF